MVALPSRASVYSLGVVLDPGLLLDCQIAAMAWGLTTSFTWSTNCLHSFLNKKNLATVTYALVIYQLYSCNVLYMGLILKMTLQLVQNATA